MRTLVEHVHTPSLLSWEEKKKHTHTHTHTQKDLGKKKDNIRFYLEFKKWPRLTNADTAVLKQTWPRLKKNFF